MKSITAVLTIVLVLLASVAFSANKEEAMSFGFSEKQAKLIMETMELQLDFIERTPYEEFVGKDVQAVATKIAYKFAKEEPSAMLTPLLRGVLSSILIMSEEKSGIPVAVMFRYSAFFTEGYEVVFPLHVIQDSHFPNISHPDLIKWVEKLTAPYAENPKYLVRK